MTDAEKLTMALSALTPFAGAYQRLRYYSSISPADDAALYASATGDHLYELLDGIEGDPVRVAALKEADEVLSLLTSDLP